MEANNIYHIYNRGNNKQLIFHNRDNYLYFLNKIRKHISPYCELLCYCLMPNHFHLLVSLGPDFEKDKFSNSYKTMLSSYTRAINRQNNKKGSLFQQNSKFKLVTNFEYVCFHYIHQNPTKAKLVSKMEDWEFSSFQDYCGLRNGTLCNKNEVYKLLDIPEDMSLFYKESYKTIQDEIVDLLS